MALRRFLDQLRHDLGRIRTKDSFSHNAFAVFSGNTVSLASQLLLTPLIARIYGPEAYGIYGLFTALVMNFSAFTDLGYSNAYVLPKEDGRFMHLLRLNFSLLGVILVLTVLLAVFSDLLYTVFPGWGMLGGFIWFVPFCILTYSTAIFFTQWFTRLRAFKTSVYIGSSATVGTRVFNFAYGLIRKGSIHGLIIGDVVVGGIASVVYWMAMAKHGAGRIFREWSWRGIREMAVEYKRYPLLTFPERWVSLIGMQLPVFLLIGDPVIVGQFALSGALLLIPLRLLGYSFSTVYVQKAAETVDADPALLGRITKGLYQRLFLIGLLPFTGLIFFSDEVFRIVLGDAWRDAGVITAYMGLFFYFRMMSEPMVALFYVKRREHTLLVFQTILTLARIGVMLPLIYAGYSAGTAILGFAMVSGAGYLVLGALLLHAAGQRALFLTARTLVITAISCAVFASLRFLVLGTIWPSL